MHLLDVEYTRTYAGLCGYSRVYVNLKKIKDEKSLIWVCQRPSGTGSGGAYILLIMHCWHYPRRSWFKIIVFWFQGEQVQKENMVVGLNDD